MTIIVTGGAGFIGTFPLLHLLWTTLTSVL